MKFFKHTSILLYTRAFTLIELLIVIGILGVLVVAVLLTLNPAAAQQRSRDTKRMKDLGTLQAALDQYYTDNAPPAAAISVTSSGGTTACGTNWTGLALCPYVTTVPIDPLNNTSRPVAGATGATACPTTQAAQTVLYRLNVGTSGLYEINVRQESPQNCKNLTNDGGNSNYWAEVGTDKTLLTD